MQLTEREKNKYCEETLKYKRDIEWRFLSLGERLYRIKQELFYEAGWGSWEEYEMEFKLPASTVSRLIRIYTVFILKYGFAPAQLAEHGWSCLAEMLPVINAKTTKERVSELLNTVAQQPRTDVRRTIREIKSGVSMSECKHKDTYTIKFCRNCKDRWTVYDDKDASNKGLKR